MSHSTQKLNTRPDLYSNRTQRTKEQLPELTLAWRDCGDNHNEQNCSEELCWRTQLAHVYKWKTNVQVNVNEQWGRNNTLSLAAGPSSGCVLRIEAVAVQLSLPLSTLYLLWWPSCKSTSGLYANLPKLSSSANRFLEPCALAWIKDMQDMQHCKQHATTWNCLLLVCVCVVCCYLWVCVCLSVCVPATTLRV